MTGQQFADFAAMRDDYHKWGIITVNTDFSERTIFGTPFTNFNFAHGTIWRILLATLILRVTASYAQCGIRLHRSGI